LYVSKTILFNQPIMQVPPLQVAVVVCSMSSIAFMITNIAKICCLATSSIYFSEFFMELRGALH
jgi:hypothetical protein